MDINDAKRKVMAAKLIADHITDTVKPLRTELLAKMTADGIETLRVKDGDGTNFGVVYVGRGKEKKAIVTDSAAFTRWVADRYPSEIEQVVRAAFAKKLLDAAGKSGQVVPVDIETGEVIPGVELTDPEPYLAVKATPIAKELMAETLTGSGLLALGAGLPATTEGEVPGAEA